MVDAVSTEEFEEMIAGALDSLPEDIQKKLDNLEIVLEDQQEASPHLLGLYQGIPQTRRGVYYSFVLPDKITVFKRTIERYARDKVHLAAMVQRVVRHEIAHHFGFSEADLQKH